VNKAFDYLSWGFIAVFAAPTILIMASWSSLPGDTMYGVKRSFEQTLLAVARPSYDAQASLNSHYTKRRLEEAKTLLASRQSYEGLSLLSAQVQATKVMIEKAPTVEKKREAAKQYITTLQGVSNELKAQQVKTKARPTAKPVKRQFAPDTSAQQLQANLQMQLDQVLALQAELQQQSQQSLSQQSQQLQAQLALQAQQLRALQQQAAAQPANAPASAEIQAIAEQLSVSQQETETIAEQITDVVVAPPSGGVVNDTSITDVDDEIQEVIDELEIIASQPDITEQEDGEDNGDQGRGNNRSNSDGNNQGRQDDNNDNNGNNNGDGGNSPDN